ncbi:hypothetical protein NKG94_10890 [Micromonospora sp. M12]
MGDLRKPFLLLAMLAIVLAIGVELGAGLLLGGADAGAALADSAGTLDVELDDVSGVSEPSGRGTGYLALIDAVAVWSTGLFCLGLLLPERVQGRVQGVASLIFSIILIIVGLVALVIVFVELMIMVSLFLAVPFGTLAYLALWGSSRSARRRCCSAWCCCSARLGRAAGAGPAALPAEQGPRPADPHHTALHGRAGVPARPGAGDPGQHRRRRGGAGLRGDRDHLGLVLLIGSIPAIVKAVRVTAALPTR